MANQTVYKANICVLIKAGTPDQAIDQIFDLLQDYSPDVLLDWAHAVNSDGNRPKPELTSIDPNNYKEGSGIE